MAITNISMFRNFTKKTPKMSHQVQLSSQEIIPYSKYVVEKKSGTTVYDVFHQNNKVTRVVKNGQLLEDKGLIKKIVKAMAKICFENGVIPRNIIGNFSKKELNGLMKSMRA